MITETELKTQTQHAIAKVSLAQQVAKAVISEVGTEYLRSSELIHKPLVRVLVRDAGQLSVVLSDAYGQGLLGRELSPLGRERYAYGKPGKQAGESRKVIKSAKPVTGYSVSITKHDADDVLDFLSRNAGATFVKNEDGYHVHMTCADKAAALDFIVANDLLLPCVRLIDVR